MNPNDNIDFCAELFHRHASNHKLTAPEKTDVLSGTINTIMGVAQLAGSEVDDNTVAHALKRCMEVLETLPNDIALPVSQNLRNQAANIGYELHR